MASFEAIFATAEAHGLRLNSFNQARDGLFRANFCTEIPGKEMWFAPVAKHGDPRAALEAALEIAMLGKSKRSGKPAATVVHEHREEAEARGLFD